MAKKLIAILPILLGVVGANPELVKNTMLIAEKAPHIIELIAELGEAEPLPVTVVQPIVQPVVVPESTPTPTPEPQVQAYDPLCMDVIQPDEGTYYRLRDTPGIKAGNWDGRSMVRPGETLCLISQPPVSDNAGNIWQAVHWPGGTVQYWVVSDALMKPLQ